MRKIFRQKRNGMISLAEVIAVLVIASRVVVSVIQIYNRASSVADSLNRFIEKDDVAKSVLQRIAEDIDKLATSGSDAILKLENKFESGFIITRLSIENRIYDKDNKATTFEKVTWQSSYDDVTGGLVLYRAHSGQAVEDKILAEYGDDTMAWKDRELFVPVCSGMSFFKIDVPKNNLPDSNMPSNNMPKKNTFDSNMADSNMLGNLALTNDMIEGDDKWDQATLPASLRLIVSFGPVVKLATGGFEVEEQDKVYRTVAIDRTRKIKYQFVQKEFNLPDGNDLDDANDVNDVSDINDVNVPKDTAGRNR
jgi:hypothetical protein